MTKREELALAAITLLRASDDDRDLDDVAMQGFRIADAMLRAAERCSEEPAAVPEAKPAAAPEAGKQPDPWQGVIKTQPPPTLERAPYLYRGARKTIACTICGKKGSGTRGKLMAAGWIDNATTKKCPEHRNTRKTSAGVVDCEQAARMLRMRIEGKSVVDIAQHFNLSRGTVSRVLAQTSAPDPSMPLLDPPPAAEARANGAA